MRRDRSVVPARRPRAAHGPRCSGNKQSRGLAPRLLDACNSARQCIGVARDRSYSTSIDAYFERIAGGWTEVIGPRTPIPHPPRRASRRMTCARASGSRPSASVPASRATMGSDPSEVTRDPERRTARPRRRNSRVVERARRTARRAWRTARSSRDRRRRAHERRRAGRRPDAEAVRGAAPRRMRRGFTGRVANRASVAGAPTPNQAEVGVEAARPDRGAPTSPRMEIEGGVMRVQTPRSSCTFRCIQRLLQGGRVEVIAVQAISAIAESRLSATPGAFCRAILGAPASPRDRCARRPRAWRARVRIPISCESDGYGSRQTASAGAGVGELPRAVLREDHVRLCRANHAQPGIVTCHSTSTSRRRLEGSARTIDFVDEQHQ